MTKEEFENLQPNDAVRWRDQTEIRRVIRISYYGDENGLMTASHPVYGAKVDGLNKLIIRSNLDEFTLISDMVFEERWELKQR